MASSNAPTRLPDGGAKGYYTYILRCSDGSLYTGWTTDPVRRLAVHNAGRGSRYTRARRPVTLLYLEAHASRGEAMRRERTIKRMSRAHKLSLEGLTNALAGAFSEGE
ncbi:MAG: GIY-YIG nuclease family protein [Anaerolineae bacterium]